MLPKDEDSGDDEYYIPGSHARRKNNRTLQPPKSLIKPQLYSKNDLPKDVKASSLHQALSKALPIILSDATSAISFRLGEHRLENLREEISVQGLKSILKAWRYEFEVRTLWSQRLNAQSVSNAWYRKRSVVQKWEEFTGFKKLRKRWQADLISKVDSNAKERVFTSWKKVKGQYIRLKMIIARKLGSNLRNCCKDWREWVVSSKLWNHLVRRIVAAKQTRFARLCLQGMLAVVRANTSFYRTSALILRCRKNDIYSLFRSWRGAIRQVTILRISEGRCISKCDHLKCKWFFYLWFDIQKHSRHLRNVEATLSRSTLAKKQQYALECLNSTVFILKSIERRGETLAWRRGRRLVFNAWLSFRSYFDSRYRVAHAAEKVAYRHLDSLKYQVFWRWCTVFVRGRRRLRAMRLRSTHLIGHSHMFLLDWAAKTKRSSRFHLFTKQFLRGVGKPLLCLFSHFEHWKRRATEYWSAWRKIEKFRRRSGDQIKAVFFLTWLRDRKIKANFSIFLRRFQAKKASDFFYAWAETVDIVILRMQKIQQGINRLTVCRQLFHTTSVIDFWHLKAYRRKKVIDLTAKKDELHEQKEKSTLKSLFISWTHHIRRFKSREARISKMHWNRIILSTSTVLQTWKLKAGYFKSLSQKNKVLSSNIRYSQLKASFQILGFHSRCMRNRRVVFERNASRSDSQIRMSHFAKWKTLNDRVQIRAARVKHFIKWKTERRALERALSLWMGKHIRTAAYDQILIALDQSIIKNTFASWIYLKGFVKTRERKAVHGARRKQTEGLDFYFSLWMLDHNRHCERKGKAASRFEKNLDQVKISTFNFWRIQHLLKLRENALEVKIGMRIGRKLYASKQNCFECWTGYLNEMKRWSDVLQGISDRANKRFLQYCFESWFRPTSMKSRGKVIAAKYLRKGQSETIKAWAAALDASIVMDKRLSALEARSVQKSQAVAFRGLSSVLQVSWSRERDEDEIKIKTNLSCLNKAVRSWFHFHRNIHHRQRVVRFLQDKVALDCRSTAIGSWKKAFRRDKRMTMYIESWERRDIYKSFEHWVHSIAHLRFGKAKVQQNRTMWQSRKKSTIFYSWYDVYVHTKKRRWALQFFCDKSVSRFCSKALHGLYTFAVQERRRKVLVVHLQRTTSKIKFFQAARFLIDFTKDSIRCKNLLEKGYSRYLVRMVRASWDMWASKILAKKRTTAVLAKAGAVLIGMM